MLVHQKEIIEEKAKLFVSVAAWWRGLPQRSNCWKHARGLADLQEKRGTSDVAYASFAQKKQWARQLLADLCKTVSGMQTS